MNKVACGLSCPIDRFNSIYRQLPLIRLDQSDQCRGLGFVRLRGRLPEICVRLLCRDANRRPRPSNPVDRDTWMQIGILNLSGTECPFFKLGGEDSLRFVFRMNRATFGGRIWDSTTELLPLSVKSAI